MSINIQLFSRHKTATAWPRGKWMIPVFLLALLVGMIIHQTKVGAAAPMAGTISGTVFRDYNANGVDDGDFEPGIAGVIVTATSITGTVVSTVTGPDGSYTTPFLPGNSARVEFTLPGSLDFLQPGAAGNTTVQFVDLSLGDATGVDVGFNNPVHYCETNPYMAVPSYFGGTQSLFDGLARFSYNDTGTSPDPTTLTTWTDIGTTYGLAYNAAADHLFAAAYVKRHSALAGSAGAIYRVTGARTAGPYVTSTLATIPDVGSVPDNATRVLPTNPVDASFDPTVFGLVGRAGLGDMEISDDGSTLYVVNLNNLNVYPVATATGTVGTPIPIPNPGCTNGEWRPFATKFYEGGLYVGGICSAENGGVRADLTAQVYRYDVTAATWSSGLFSSPIPLDFQRGRGFSAGTMTGPPDDGFWNPWINDGPTLFSRLTANTGDGGILYPQPMLTDIEFDSQGYMLLGFRDRTGDQIGYLNNAVDSAAYPAGSGGLPIWYTAPAGDILIAAPSGSNFVLESNGVVGSRTRGAGGGIGTGQGPGPAPSREFFYHDAYTTPDYNIHQETGFGALAIRLGADEVVMTAYDYNTIDEGAVYRLNLADGGGNVLDGYRIYEGSQTGYPGGGTENGRFGKANGLGDLELLCSPAPIEIGNRVWGETSVNGIQDPEQAGVEVPIAGVTIRLYLPSGAFVAETTTNANGVYYFNNGNVPGGLLPNTQYVLRIENVTPIQSAGFNYLTPANVGTNEAIDNDAVSGNAGGVFSGNRPQIVLSTGAYGHNNHTYDFGFTATPTAITLQDIGVRPPTTGIILAVGLLLLSGMSLIFIRGRFTGYGNSHV